MNVVNFTIIGYMHSPYQEKFGIPRQPNLVDVESYIEMIEPYNDLLAFEGIETFSHIWLIWQFHENKNQNDRNEFRPQVRPPRLGGNKKIGIFATRSMYRPSPVGLSVVKIKEVKKIGKAVRLYVTGSDLLNGTPIIDIKPYIQYSDAVIYAESGYAQEEQMRKEIIWAEDAELEAKELLINEKITRQMMTELEQVLSLDPRPAYQNDEQRIYGMKLFHLDIKFKVIKNKIFIVKLVNYNK
ncbi:tRNA (N6-threonylcarbamoyladenosine(37)-N6)-methyltransferase TrmO [Acinetobacter sp. ANC 4558]|uniref:tRNA (N6-threonylcarbamoyladenosine(37)-N6)-methyltransferase TrmO n=1 Tax=Acinetobacter sp. ANC 4558 TaxID=1977876 RepID=UPI000A342082|nr:tRNA (N6-threonylcarbamoyladenosine(37)-N6)-methyltransferase TrmO [Acinetobacter sp. ANC 4558]OTG86372.1 tRNA (N6-threonylcarbamoyladenosine(37)-N6)-methyltransferase TrmO [Acinetobacter sp. ANC 4558]